MLTLADLERLLALNEQELWKAMSDKNETRRLFELMLHRTIIKDMIIELLREEVAVLVKKEAA